MRDGSPDAGTPWYRIAKAVAGPPLRAYFRLRVEGAGHVPGAGPCILAANHQSYLDPIVLGAACPRPVRFMMIRRFWAMPVIGWASRALGSFPVDEDRILPGTLKQALGVLRGGGVLGIFPEGRIVEADPLGPPRPGVGHLALRAGVPVVPVRIAGTRRAFPKGRVLPRPHQVRIRFGEPILPPSDSPRDPSRADALAAAVMAGIAALAG